VGSTGGGAAGSTGAGATGSTDAETVGSTGAENGAAANPETGGSGGAKLGASIGVNTGAAANAEICADLQERGLNDLCRFRRGLLLGLERRCAAATNLTTVIQSDAEIWIGPVNGTGVSTSPAVSNRSIRVSQLPSDGVEPISSDRESIGRAASMRMEQRG
jgi:hypothetical protein